MLHSWYSADDSTAGVMSIAVAQLLMLLTVVNVSYWSFSVCNCQMDSVASSPRLAKVGAGKTWQTMLPSTEWPWQCLKAMAIAYSHGSVFPVTPWRCVAMGMC